jgi:iron(III) transport system permease protein
LNFELTNFTLKNYIEAYSSPSTYKMLFNSFWFAIGSMCVALLMGGSLAFFSERTDLPFRTVIPALVMVPLVMPSVVKGIAWIYLLSPRIGLLNMMANAVGIEGNVFQAYSLTAMIWVEGISMSPLAFLLIAATLRQMDPSLEEAALGSGASVYKILTRVTLPLLMPGIAGVAILLFIRGIEAFEIPLLLGFSSGIFVFSTNIYYALRSAFPPDYGLGFAYSMTLIFLTLGALFIYQRQFKNAEKFTVVRGKGYRPRLISTGRWRYLGWACILSYMLFVVVLPMIILVWASILPFYRPPSLSALATISLDNYRALLEQPELWDAVWNTAILAGISSTVIMFLAFLSSWFVYRTNIFGRKVLDFVVFLPYALPGIVIGVAFMVMFLSFPNPIYNTIWILVIAYIVNYLPVGTRFTNAAILQIHKELEEAAQASGAGFFTTMVRIWIPLLIPSLINGMLFILILCIKVISIAVLLQGPNSTVLPVYLWSLWDVGEAGTAAALSVLMVAIVSMMMLVTRYFGANREGSAVAG